MQQDETKGNKKRNTMQNPQKAIVQQLQILGRSPAGSPREV
jgi:hypothetical protein